jgi:DNA-binding IclR family transcriptional regulator
LRVLDEVLRALSDGEWHLVSELAESLRASVEEVEEVVRFMSRYGLAVYDEKEKRVKLSEEVLRFLRELESA